MADHTTFLTAWDEPDIRVDDCEWYHWFPFLAAYPAIVPHYNLTQHLDDFLLPRSMQGRTFLDVGTGNGFLSFAMEQRGAEVVSFDVDENEDMEQIPYRGMADHTAGNQVFNRRFHRGYWYAHRQLKSRARVVYGNAMKMPSWLGVFDVVLVAAVLQHTRDPFKVLQEADKHCSDTLIVSEAYFESSDPVLRFHAQPDEPNPQFWTWWLMSPAFLVAAFKVLGYKDIEVHGPFNLANLKGGYSVASVTVKGRKR